MPIWVEIVVVTQILMVARDAIDVTLRLEGRFDVKERVEYFIGGPVKIHVNMGPGNLQQDYQLFIFSFIMKGHGSLPDFMLNSCSQNTGPW